jgi:hypothetical protein
MEVRYSRHGGRNFFLHHKILQSVGAVLNDLHHHAEQENKRKPNAKAPYVARQMSEREFSGRVAECTRPKS